MRRAAQGSEIALAKLRATCRLQEKRASQHLGPLTRQENAQIMQTCFVKGLDRKLGLQDMFSILLTTLIFRMRAHKELDGCL